MDYHRLLLWTKGGHPAYNGGWRGVDMTTGGGWGWRVGWELARTFKGHTDWLRRLASPDGTGQAQSLRQVPRGWPDHARR